MLPQPLQLQDLGSRLLYSPETLVITITVEIPDKRETQPGQITGRDFHERTLTKNLQQADIRPTIAV